MAIKFFNTLSKKKETFRSITPKKVLMYNCGPTVYDYAHIGNFKAYLFADTMRRYLEYRGYEVKQVVNITDVGHLTENDLKEEDKIQKAAREKKITPWEVAEFYTKAFLEDWKKLNLEEPMARPRATQYVKEMIEMDRVLIEKGFAYVANGSVYYDVAKFKEYGKLSGNTIEKLEEGAGGRVEDNPDKKHHYDFALWIKDPEHVMKWHSPWSTGYPGWHIECSAMSKKLLGDTIDIHTGGEDNKFPHHENEIAQSEGANGKPEANYWMHPRFLLVNGEKMSKSKGNFYKPQDIYDKGYSWRALRYLFLSSNYRQPLNFTFEALKDAENTVKGLIEFMDRLDDYGDFGDNNPEIKTTISKAKKEFAKGMDDDLNTPIAFAAVHELVSAANRAMAEKQLSKKDAKNIRKTMDGFDKVMGVLEHKKETVPEEIMTMVKEREKARKEKDWRMSDQIRDRIKNLGWAVDDTKDGIKVKRI